MIPRLLAVLAVLVLGPCLLWPPREVRAEFNSLDWLMVGVYALCTLYIAASVGGVLP